MLIRTRGLTHIALRVPDTDSALHFYRDVFGMTGMSRSETTSQAQKPWSKGDEV
jgi:catechol 2,3-dioxygenase-like lactoylglutathione lyase family enzyme